MLTTRRSPPDTEPRVRWGSSLKALAIAVPILCGCGADPPARPEKASAESTAPTGAAASPTAATALRPEEALALGAMHSCALSAAGEVSCWGSNSFRQLGDPEVPAGHGAQRVQPRAVAGLGRTARLVAGAFHTCAIDVHGDVRCWGHGGFGQLGDGERTDRGHPVEVDLDATQVVQLAAGERHTCARDGEGGVSCWGDNTFGQLGDGTSTARRFPHRLSDVQATDLTAGRYHTCALSRRDGVATAACWGAGFEGQLGPVPRPEGFRATPTEIPLPSDVGSVVAGSDFVCALTRTGDHGRSALCWGGNGLGQLGPGRSVVTRPRPLAQVVGFDSLAPGGGHQCARFATEIRCWGANAKGQLGDGTETSRRHPVRVAPLPDARAVAAGPRHSCAISGSGDVYCWGSAVHGQVGSAETDERTEPRAIEGLRLPLAEDSP